MKQTSLFALLAIAVTGLGIVGSAALASGATQATTQTPETLSAQTETTEQADPAGQLLSDSEVPDATEQQTLQGQATITSLEAVKAAQTVVSGTPSHVQLENENGTVVYQVIIGTTEVKVNAADGSIVKTETAEAEHGSGTEDMTTGLGNEPNDPETNDNKTTTTQ